MNCPVLTELELTEAYEPEHENPPVLSGGSYDIDAIRSCGEGCKMAAENARLREALKEAGASLLTVACIKGFGDNGHEGGNAFEDLSDLRQWADSRTREVKNALVVRPR